MARLDGVNEIGEILAQAGGAAFGPHRKVGLAHALVATRENLRRFKAFQSPAPQHSPHNRAVLLPGMRLVIRSFGRRRGLLPPKLLVLPPAISGAEIMRLRDLVPDPRFHFSRNPQIKGFRHDAPL